MANFTYQPVAQPENPYKVQQRGTFKEFQAGAGSSVFKSNKEGTWVGGTNYNDGKIKFSYDGKFYATDGEIAGDFIVSGGLIAGDTEGYNARFGIYGSNAGLILKNSSSYKGGLYFFNGSTKGVMLNSDDDDILIDCGSGKSIILSSGGELIGHFDSDGWHPPA